MRYKGAVRCMAIPMELLLRSILDLEGSPHPRYLPLASTNYTGDRCRVRKPHPNTYESANHVRLPGTPLWLAATYSSRFGLVNKRWPPSMWYVVF